MIKLLYFLLTFHTKHQLRNLRNKNIQIMNKIENPFLIYGYEGPEYFCGRKEETAEII